MGENVEFSQEVIDYILKNENADPFALTLKMSPFSDVEMKVIARQIQGRKIAKKKFPFLLNVEQFRYPKKESLEQSSSEATAKFKTNNISGKSFVDLTGGMGIDAYLLGRKFQSCAYVEPNEELYQSTVHNFQHLGFDYCKTFNTTCEDFLETNKNRFDWAYIDPSRRVDGKRKMSIYNYEPNVVELQQKLTALADNLLVKLSPMQDISECVRVLKNVHKIWVISIQNEVKELLLHIKSDESSSPSISAVDLYKDQREEFSYPFEQRICEVQKGALKTYLYQPSASIVKAELQNRYTYNLGLQKLHPNTQLFTSNQKIDDFMGRIFLVKECINLNKKEIKRALPEMKANVITKNFPMSPQEIIRKFKLKEGRDKYVIAFTDYENRKLAAVCNRIN